MKEQLIANKAKLNLVIELLKYSVTIRKSVDARLQEMFTNYSITYPKYTKGLKEGFGKSTTYCIKAYKEYLVKLKLELVNNTRNLLVGLSTDLAEEKLVTVYKDKEIDSYLV